MNGNLYPNSIGYCIIIIITAFIYLNFVTSHFLERMENILGNGSDPWKHMGRGWWQFWRTVEGKYEFFEAELFLPVGAVITATFRLFMLEFFNLLYYLKYNAIYSSCAAHILHELIRAPVDSCMSCIFICNIN